MDDLAPPPEATSPVGPGIGEREPEVSRQAPPPSVRPSPNTEAAQPSPPPDWARVPFAVTCARCAHDLHGRSEPQCPDCGLTFDWAEAVPLEHLFCRHCGYHLYGLEQTRCPECGTDFTWEEALADHRRRQCPLFEFQFTRRPVRSFIYSVRSSLRPARLWKSIDLFHIPRRGTLHLLAFVCLVAAFAFILLFEGLALLLWQLDYGLRGPGQRQSLLEILHRTWRAFRFDEALSHSASLLSWSAALYLSLLVYRQSMRRGRIRHVHMRRVAVYASLVPAVAFVVLGYLPWLAYVMSELSSGIRPTYPLTVALAVLAFHSLRHACRSYLKLPHAGGIAAASLLIATMTAGIIDMAVGRGPAREFWLIVRDLFPF